MLALPALAPPASAERRVEVYKARFRTADELLPLATTALGDHGEVALDPGTNTLVLMGSPAAVAEALELLSIQDRRLRTVVLHHTTRRARDLTARGLAIRWQATTASFRVGQVGTAQPPAGSLDASGDDARSTSTRASAELRAVDATSGFEATTRILDDGRVQVDLGSFARDLLPGGLIGTTKGSNAVVLQPGVVVAIGGLSADSAGDRAETGAGGTTTRAGDETILLIRADVDGNLAGIDRN